MTDIKALADKMDKVTEKVSDIGTKLEVHITKFNSHIENEDKTRQALVRNTDILQSNTASLEEHMQRTDLLEAYVKKVDQRLAPVELATQRKQAVIDWWKDVIVVVAKVGAAVTAITVILKALSLLLMYN